MKPSFALSLSFEGIGLLHRAFPGWNRVGEVGLDSPDLNGELAVLRETAQQINGTDLTSKVVVPNDQIKYLTLDLGVQDEAGRSDAIARALDGATPYPVNELVYDWSVDGERTTVAAVARQTLEEAEAFALTHGFGPVSFVAIPENGQFAGEPFFGPTQHAASLLGEGEEVQRDMAAIRVTGVARLPQSESIESAAPPPKAEAAVPVQEAAVAVDVAEEIAEEPAENTDTGLEPGLDTEFDAGEDGGDIADEDGEGGEDPEPVLRFTHAGAGVDGDAARIEPSDDPIPEDQIEATAGDDGIPAEEADPLPAGFSFSTVRAQADAGDTSTAPSLSGVTRDAPDLIAPSIPIPAAEDEADTDAAPEIEATPESYEPEVFDAEGLQGEGAAPDGEDRWDDIPPMPGYLSGESQDAPPIEAPEYWPEEQPDAESRATQGTGAGAGAALAAVGQRGVAAAGGLAAGIGSALSARRARREEARASAGNAQDTQQQPDIESERQRMTVFGARKKAQPKKKAVIGGKPKYLGLILTAVLLLFLAGVAAWASIFVEDGLARFFRAAPDREIAVLPADAADEMAIEGEEAMVLEPPEPGYETASLDPGTSDIPTPQAQSRPRLPHALTRQEAQARYAVSGVWQRAPTAPGVPDSQKLDDLYVASIDPSVDGADAVALPDAVTQATDFAMSVLPRPATRGERFQMDARGLVIASAGGTLSPDGFLVFAGRPARVPGDVPQRAERPQPLSEADQRIASVRPRVRPGGLVETNERSTLGGLTRAELASKRPRTRPEQAVAKVEEEAAEVASEFAVAASRKPNARPRNFDRIVTRARKKAETSEERKVTRVAAVPAPAVQPRIPSKSNVAKQATVRNAINLRKINLIGVYGKPSSRRALVRLSSGRYKKVKVGDRLDGGRVSAIGDAELRYQKSGRNVVLKMPRG